MKTASIKSGLSWLYAMAVHIHQPGISTVRAPIPVISVGNLEVGGTGKSPIAQALCHSLSLLGHQPAIFSRGYRGKLKGPVKVDPLQHSALHVGDEPLMHAQNGFDCYICADRAKAIQLAQKDGIDVAVLDDGHATKSVMKDHCILVFRPGFSAHPQLMPAGRLREPLNSGLARAHSVIVNGEPTLEDKAFLQETGLPLIVGSFQIQAAPDRHPRTLVSAVANPGRVLNTAKNAGWNVAEHLIFPDHHRFSKKELQRLDKTRALLTTAKDFVKFPSHLQKKTQVLHGHWRAHNEQAYQNLLQRFLQIST